jgi:hypothetical protein
MVSFIPVNMDFQIRLNKDLLRIRLKCTSATRALPPSSGLESVPIRLKCNLSIFPLSILATPIGCVRGLSARKSIAPGYISDIIDGRPHTIELHLPRTIALAILFLVFDKRMHKDRPPDFLKSA